MMRTYYWNDRVIGKASYFFRKIISRNYDRYFVVGNAGDIFGRDIISQIYGEQSVNVPNEGRRLLVIGSIGHKILPGDVVCGIGSKTPELAFSRANADVLVYGLRGPMSYEAFRRAGYDVSQVKFLFDPGLLIRRFVDTNRLPDSGKIGFIPHYRERGFYWEKTPKGIHLINIDNFPSAVAEEILSCEMVYSSSLHGIIFCHSLGRPCVFVSPRTNEPLFKYNDYFASVGLPMPVPLLDLTAGRTAARPISPADIRFDERDIQFPSAEILMARGVMV